MATSQLPCGWRLATCSAGCRSSGTGSSRLAQVAVPAASLQEGPEVLLKSSDGFAFRAHSAHLRLISPVLAGSLASQPELLQRALAQPAQPVLISFDDSGEHLLLLLQVQRRPAACTGPAWAHASRHLVAQVLYSRSMKELLRTWFMWSLMSLAALADKLNLPADICEAIESAAVEQLDTFLRRGGNRVQLLSWVDRVHFTALREALVKSVAARCCDEELGAVSKDHLLLVAKELHAQVGALRTAAASQPYRRW